MNVDIGSKSMAIAFRPCFNASIAVTPLPKQVGLCLHQKPADPDQVRKFVKSLELDSGGITGKTLFFLVFHGPMVTSRGFLHCQ